MAPFNKKAVHFHKETWLPPFFKLNVVFVLALLSLGLPTQSYSSCCLFDYGDGPLCPCSWRFGTYAGIAPIWYQDIEKDLYLGDDGVNDTGIVAKIEGFDFADCFKYPWAIKLHAGYSFSSHVEGYFEGKYTHADGEKVRTTVLLVPLLFDFDSWDDLEIDVGLRYHFGSYDVCECVIWPFVGTKLGARFYDRVTCDLNIGTAIQVKLNNLTLYERTTVPSIGFEAGLEAQLTSYVSLFFMVEAVWSGQLKPNENLPLASGTTTFQTISIANTGTLFQLPITLGLNWIY
jgi:hypothetical protein